MEVVTILLNCCIAEMDQMMEYLSNEMAAISASLHEMKVNVSVSQEQKMNATTWPGQEKTEAVMLKFKRHDWI
jgi:hypothetical protein